MADCMAGKTKPTTSAVAPAPTASSTSTSFAIVGAGISGLGSAYHIVKTARRIGQSVNVVIFEKNDCPGGTWSKASIYPGLITNNTWDQMLFDDEEVTKAIEMFESDESAQGGPGGWRASGDGVLRIMEAIARQLLAMGVEIRYSTSVDAVRQNQPQCWDVTSSPLQKPLAKVTERFDKLVVATGTFSTPALPAFSLPFVQPAKQPILDPLAPFAIHTSHLSDPSVQTAIYARERTIVIVGASKSSLDAAERLATFGHHVHLVFRNGAYTAPPSGPVINGKPTSFVPMIGTRFKMAPVPYYRDPISGYHSHGGVLSSLYRRFLHYTYIGSIYCERLFRFTFGMYSAFNRWTEPLTSLAKPTVPVKWSEGSMFPGPATFAPLVQSGKITIIKGGVIGMQRSIASGGAEKDGSFTLRIRMVDGSERDLEAQGVIFGTGWNTGTYPFFTTEMMDELGLPLQYSAEKPPQRESDFIDSDAQAQARLDREILTMRDRPAAWSDVSYSARRLGLAAGCVAPYRLYRSIVPVSHLDKRDVAFPGITTSKANHVVIMVQSHWIADYFFDTLGRPLPSEAKCREEISSHVTWSRALFGPAHGMLGQWIGGPWMEYLGRLCWDMGVPDVKGLKTVITSTSYNLEAKRAERDARRGSKASLGS